MTFDEEIPFYVDWRNEPECKHSFQLIVNTNCPSVEIYMEQHDKKIRADERERTVKEIAKASSSKELNENIDYCMKTISLCEMTTERRKELCETLLSQRAILTEFEKQIRANILDEIAEDFNEHLFDSQMMNPIMTRNEILLFLEQLKDKRNE